MPLSYEGPAAWESIQVARIQVRDRLSDILGVCLVTPYKFKIAPHVQIPRKTRLPTGLTCLDFS